MLRNLAVKKQQVQSLLHLSKRTLETDSHLSQYITLANGISIPRVGLGTWQLSSADICKQAVKNALQAGVRLIDTAPAYRNEKVIGDVVKHFVGYDEKAFLSSTGKGLFLSSKAGPHQMGTVKIEKACQETLSKLGQDSIDLYLLQWPGAHKAPPSSDIHRKMRHESWLTLEKLYQNKKCRAIGVCNFLPHHLNALIEDGIDTFPMVNQIEVHPMCPNWEIRDYAKSKNMMIQAYSPFGSGNPNLINHSVVKEVAERERRSVYEVLLCWVIQHDLLVIPRSTVLQHIQQNLATITWNLSEESMNQLNNICPPAAGHDVEVHFCWNPMSVPN